ncbi:MAG TPA: amino acid ABC transporter permease [Marmoricola sp.]|nr:amino acid ABC transporter permease [Marmoricola sp.]
MSNSVQPAPGSPGAGAVSSERPGTIEAVPVRHPGRWVAIAVIAVLVAMFVHMVLTNPAFNWPFVFEAMIQTPVLEGLLKGTILVTVLSMLIGVSLGVVMAVMRLSDNPILAGVAWLFTWFFRAVPRLVLLTIMGTLGILFKDGIALGVPFDRQIMDFIGLTGDLRFVTLDANAIFGGLFGGALGLGVSEAAYMAEIARAGILSVDPGQKEAASALGMSNSQAMRRIVLPQAMRVIVPPTGNETIAMVKDTSLLIGLPLITEMFFQMQSIGSRTYQTFPVLVGATIWYLLICSLLMLVQVQLEKKFGKGFGAKPPTPNAYKAKMLKLRTAGGGMGGV